MYRYIVDHLNDIERQSGALTRQSAIAELRKLGLGDFVNVLSQMPLTSHPAVSAVLPPMTPDDVCKQWTGNTGPVVMELAVDFVRSCAERYCAMTGRPLQGRRILDFGCGYGRFLRCFSFFSDEVFGVDAWEASLKHCRRAGLGDVVFQSAETPDVIPAPGPFDLLTAFSVFTHLGPEATARSLTALRTVAAPGAVLVITIRPIEFWRFAVKGRLSSQHLDVDRCIAEHEQTGFAFLKEPLRDHYGDTSMSIAWLTAAAAAAGWTVGAVDRSLNDALQRYVFMTPR